MAGFWSSVVGAFTNSGGSSGGSSGGGSVWGDIAKGVLGGLSAKAASKEQRESTREGYAANLEAERQRGIESRRSTSFEADLLDYYKKKDNKEKRLALDTYGQFATLRNWKPNYVNTPMPTVPARPLPEGQP